MMLAPNALTETIILFSKLRSNLQIIISFLTKFLQLGNVVQAAKISFMIFWKICRAPLIIMDVIMHHYLTRNLGWWLRNRNVDPTANIAKIYVYLELTLVVIGLHWSTHNCFSEVGFVIELRFRKFDNRDCNLNFFFFAIFFFFSEKNEKYCLSSVGELQPRWVSLQKPLRKCLSPRTNGLMQR